MRFLTFTEGLILSICLHLAFIGVLFIYNINFPSPVKQETVTIDLVSPPPTMADLEAKMKKARPIPPVMKNQVVDQDAKNHDKAEDTRFLSAHDQKVEKQTVARNKGVFKNVAKPSLKKQMKMANLEKALKNKIEKVKPMPLNLKPSFDPLAIKERQQKSETQKSDGAENENAEGGDVSQTEDYIKDVNQSDQTMLNTREFKYFTYYSRIRRQLSQHWEPKVREKLVRLFRSGRTIASDRDHTTKLLIVLNDVGVLVKVQVLGESGVHDLDDAAMEAFRSAAPFPNPPKGIIDADKTVKIRWDFVLES